MDNNQEQKKIAIETYDGDPDDLVYFQTQEELTTLNASENENQPEIANRVEEIQEKLYAATNGNEEGTEEGEQEPHAVPLPENKGIDPNDPHYAGYEPDPYYDFGYGPEPEPKPETDKNDGSALGAISLATGIASNLMFCCGPLGNILILTALVTGIWCLCLKVKFGAPKIMAIIGIVCALIMPAISIASTTFFTFLSVLENH